MARRKQITKKMLENLLYDMATIDYVTEIDENGEEVQVKIAASDKQAKIQAIKALCEMKGFNKPTETIVTNKVYKLKF